MSQKTGKAFSESVGSIQYSPSPSASPLIRISWHEEPGTKDFEPFFAARNHDQSVILTWGKSLLVVCQLSVKVCAFTISSSKQLDVGNVPVLSLVVCQSPAKRLAVSQLRGSLEATSVLAGLPHLLSCSDEILRFFQFLSRKHCT